MFVQQEVRFFFFFMVRVLKLGLGPHAITGNGVGFKPDILNMDVMESVLEVMYNA